MFLKFIYPDSMKVKNPYTIPFHPFSGIYAQNALRKWGPLFIFLLDTTQPDKFDCVEQGL